MIPNERPGKAPEYTGGRSFMDKFKNALSRLNKQTLPTDATGLLDIELYDGSPSYPGVSEVLLKPSEDPVAEGVRYLPWVENKLTFCRLEPQDRWVFTGPLTGCSIYVATLEDRTYLFHVNSNEDKTPGAKDRKLAAAVDGLLSGARITQCVAGR